MAQDTLERRAYSPAEMARIVGISKSLAYELVRSGAIFSVRAGRRWIVPVEAVEAFRRGQHWRPEDQA